MPHIVVEIPLVATRRPREEITARNAVTEELSGLAIGTCTGAGGGMGSMDFSYRIADESKARAAIEQAMSRHMPGSAYRIRVRA